MKSILVTTGEPAGIGPDLCLMLPLELDVILIGDINVLKDRAALLGIKIKLIEIDVYSSEIDDETELGRKVWHVPVLEKVVPGQLNPKNSGYVLEILTLATNACLANRYSAIATAPIHKGVINQANIPFTGHTEYFSSLCGDKDVVMMLVCEAMRVALVTTHLSLSTVSSHITTEHLSQVLEIVEDGLRTQFKIACPRILVAGLNPHAGEGGYLGREEIEIIEPVIQSFKQKGWHIQGPLPADTIFTPHLLSEADAVITMYHDQGLPVLKYAGFGEAVNVTLGLPFVRTSVDHGTALSLAGTGNAKAGSLIAAIKLAGELQCN